MLASKVKYKGEKNVIGFEVWKTEFMYLKVKSVLQNMGFAFTLFVFTSQLKAFTHWVAWVIYFISQ